MKKPIKELDLDFDPNRNDLYVVIDTTTNIEVSPIMPIKNDALAVDSFKKFCEEMKEKKAPYSKFRLLNVGTYNNQEHKIEAGDSYVVIDDSEDIEAYIKEVVDEISKNEEKE